jgi:hypothetical protein
VVPLLILITDHMKALAIMLVVAAIGLVPVTAAHARIYIHCDDDGCWGSAPHVDDDDMDDGFTLAERR